MRQIVGTLLIFLFFLQGATNLTGLTMIILLALLFLPFLGSKKAFRVPSYFLIALGIYFFYLVIGYFNGHSSPQIDIKYQIYTFLFFLFLVNNKNKVNWLSLLFLINIICFVFYLLLYLKMIPNIWHETTFGRQGRVLGPPIIAIILMLFIYLIKGRPFDKKLVFSLFLAIVYLMLTSNFTTIGIVFSLTVLVAVNWRKLFRPIYLVGVLVLTVALIVFFSSPYVPEMIAEKVQYATRPWEYGSVQTRINDLQQALVYEDFGWFKKIFGEGFGASSRIYRFNELSPSLSRTLAFLEIDNGFYYLYHRGGWSLLLIFVLTHIYLLNKIRNVKAKLGFGIIFLCVNLLTIHYFTNTFYLLVPFYALYQYSLEVKEFKVPRFSRLDKI